MFWVLSLTLRSRYAICHNIEVKCKFVFKEERLQMKHSLNLVVLKLSFFEVSLLRRNTHSLVYTNQSYIRLVMSVWPLVAQLLEHDILS